MDSALHLCTGDSQCRNPLQTDAPCGLDVLPDEGGLREEAELPPSVYDQKPDLETMLLNHNLLRLRKTIITPHSPFNTREAVERILNTTVSDIQSCTRDKAEK